MTAEGTGGRVGRCVPFPFPLGDAIGYRLGLVALQETRRSARVCDEPPTEAFAELRAVLLAEHEWRVREGLG